MLAFARNHNVNIVIEVTIRLSQCVLKSVLSVFTNAQSFGACGASPSLSSPSLSTRLVDICVVEGGRDAQHGMQVRGFARRARAWRVTVVRVSGILCAVRRGESWTNAVAAAL